MFSEADRERWHRAAQDASSDPSMAPEVARMLARELRAAAREAESRFPIGYLYHGTRKLVAKARNLLPEAVPTEGEGPITNVPLTSTANQEIKIRVPFDCVIQGVQGWCVPRLSVDDSGENTSWAQSLSCATDFRDLFSVRWGLNGDTFYSTDGEDELILPASVTVGTQNLPRAMYWPLVRQDVITVQFRNIVNFYTLPTFTAAQTLELAEAVLVFDVLRLDPP